MQITLSSLINQDIWRIALVFARVGAAFMTLPGYGEPGLPVRIRILAGLGFSVATEATIGGFPAAPSNVWGMLFGLAPEITTGVMLGMLSRILVSGILSSGTIIGLNVGLSNIFANGLGLEQSATVGAAVYAAFLAALFASNGHHLMLRALIGIYDVVGPGVWPDITASTHAIVSATARSFELAAELAMPFLLLALLFNCSLALVNRSLPSLPVFQIGQPALVGVGLYLLAAASSALVDRTLQIYAQTLALMH